MKIVYSTTTTEKNYCVDMSRTRNRRIQVCSLECILCPFCFNKTDDASKRKGIVMCQNDDSVILTASQFRSANPLGRQ